jgi:hypothetical protein
MYAEWSSEDWSFGSYGWSAEERAWYARHEPTVRRWIEERIKARDPYWMAARHAAWCLVTHRIVEAEMTGSVPTWACFDVGDFLFHDLWEGGTVGLEAPPEVFFDQLAEVFGRFVADGLIDREPGERWLAQLLAAREDFVRCYDPDTSTEEAMVISDRHRPGAPSAPLVSVRELRPGPPRAEPRPSRRERRANAPKKRVRKRIRRR